MSMHGSMHACAYVSPLLIRASGIRGRDVLARAIARQVAFRRRSASTFASEKTAAGIIFRSDVRRIAGFSGSNTKTTMKSRHRPCHFCDASEYMRVSASRRRRCSLRIFNTRVNPADDNADDDDDDDDDDPANPFHIVTRRAFQSYFYSDDAIVRIEKKYTKF